MVTRTYKEWADHYAARIAACEDGDTRLLELTKIWDEIQKLTSGGKRLNSTQLARLLHELKAALKELGYNDTLVAFEYRKGTEAYEILEKSSSSSISNDELRDMMRMVAKGPKP
ncbi:TPA: hypothetical protein OR518_003659 [Escherichia coli]|nr:hypothetical protein [Salmonella enterica]HCS7470080.1 hypothetical protein [Escherichia coli]